MLSIKNSLCSIFVLATYAAAASQAGESAINLSVQYCSKENTGASNEQGSNIYQTLGLCNDSCQGKFTYAVLQYQECWCSNEKPSETVSVESCNQSCPGYPDQKCGNKGAGLFAYVPLDGAPVSGGGQANSTMSSAGSASSASLVSNSTMPAASAATNGSTAGENGNSTSSNATVASSDTSDSNSLLVSRGALAMSAVLGISMGYAFGFAA